MKIDFAGSSYLKEGNLGLELKGRDRVRVLTEMVAFIALPGGSLRLFGWGWDETLEPLAYIRASSSEFCYPVLN